MGLFDKIFGSYSQRELKNITPIMEQVVALEEKYRAFSDEELKAMTPKLREELASGKTLDDVLPDAFAVCREASDRVLGMRPFPVQIIGGIVLHQGRIAEMKTGEGKTLVATLPSYLNALTGKGVHIVTVNDYLAKRDSEWMGKLHRFLGLSVGLIVHDIDPNDRKEAYNCDITYGTNNEFGFDFLRDNMVVYKERQVQRGHNYAIVDEVDSILIDEARTPLIISGPGDKSTDMYGKADKFAKTLQLIKVKELDAKEDHDDVEADYIVDEKAKTSTLTPRGVKKAERYFGVENLNDSDNNTLMHHINQAIKANGIMHRDIDYVVKDGEVLIVDEFTGRLMIGRRYNEGLHQAIEAKENVKVEKESQTLATITFQNYFRMYGKLSGMTGTAMTEEDEFREIYKLDVIEIPTNRPIVRHDYPDVVYKTENGKYNAIIDQIVECHERQQPVLVGTISIERSELLAAMLKKRGVKHEVLNAKYHEKEAEIVSQAGKPGAVTIATNMAGRGTDIMLGGNAEFMAKWEMRHQGISEDLIHEATSYGDTTDQEILDARKLFQQLNEKFKAEIAPEAQRAKDAGGLFIIGTERHESRRIDNQLRGRAGRQGDPGDTRFFISLEDDLMRLFGGERIQNMMDTLGVDEDMPIENKFLSNSIENAQGKVESRNFGIRKNVLQFDDVMNKQREIIYGQRGKVLNGENIGDYIQKMISDSVDSAITQYLGISDIRDDWNMDGLRFHFMGWILDEGDLKHDIKSLEETSKEEICTFIKQKASEKYTVREAKFGEQLTRELERVILLKNVDRHWIDHIDAMDDLRKGIYLRSYAQKDPVVEYRIEGFDMFDQMIDSIRENTVKMMLTVQVRTDGDEQKQPEREQIAKPNYAGSGDGSLKKEPIRKTSAEKTGRNDPCPCGSGKKYKKCCGRDA